MTNPPGTTTEAPDPVASRASGGSDAWKEAIATRRLQADAQAVPGAQVASIPGPEVNRRRFIRGAFWSGLGLTLLGSVGFMLDYIYPRNVRGFGGPVAAGKVTDYPAGGDPKHFLEGQFWLVNLKPDESRPGGSGGGSGLLALWHKCPHLGCTVPWRPEFAFQGDKGWFRCPCHGSTYTKAGVRVFGPAPRSMDTMAITVDGSGNVTVQTGTRKPGGTNNPQRAIKPPGLPA